MHDVGLAVGMGDPGWQASASRAFRNFDGDNFFVAFKFHWVVDKAPCSSSSRASAYGPDTWPKVIKKRTASLRNASPGFDFLVVEQAHILSPTWSKLYLCLMLMAGISTHYFPSSCQEQRNFPQHFRLKLVAALASRGRHVAVQGYRWHRWYPNCFWHRHSSVTLVKVRSPLKAPSGQALAIFPQRFTVAS